MPRGPKSSKPAPEWARVLRARRARLGLRQEDVSERTEDRVSMGTVSDLERGKVQLGNLTYPRVVDLAQALEWTVAELSEQTGVALATSDDKSSDTAPSQALESVGFVMKDVFDLLVASRPLSEAEPIPDLSPIPVPRNLARPGLVLFRVRGDSMTVGAEGIHEGDIIYVDTHDRTPHPDRVYVIHIPGDGVTLKRVRSLGGALWLFSDNPDQTRHAPFQADSASVIGRVYDLSRRPRVRL